MMWDIKRLVVSTILVSISGSVMGFPSSVDHEATEGNCVHKFPVVDDIPHPVHLESRQRVVKRSPEHQLRVKVFYDDTVERLPKSKRKIVEEVRNCKSKMKFNTDAVLIICWVDYITIF